MKKKRKSRKELKQMLSEARSKAKYLEAELAGKKRDYEELQARFRAMGNEREAIDGVDCVYAEAKPWGNYIVTYDSISREQIADAKEKLVSSLVAGLIEKDWVQLIIKDSASSPFTPLEGETKTIAAKLYVIPWDKATKRRKSK